MKKFLLLFCVAITFVTADEPTLWPPKPFVHVVAYCYDFSADTRGSSIVFPDGSLHRGIIRATTVRLVPTQVVSLQTLLSTDSNEGLGEVECYDPHHGFVFYDADWKVVASIDVCFMCENYVARPEGVTENMGLRALWKFCREVGLPTFKESSDYCELYAQEQPTAKEPEKPVKQESDSSDPFGGF